VARKKLKNNKIMFTIEQIKKAHSTVKSGADFPNYIQDLIQLGVTEYETYVKDGHTIFLGKDDFKIQSEAKYGNLEVADKSDKIQFQKDLRAHQQGETNFPTFCNDSAKSGVEKWIVNTATMTCTYYDKLEREILLETIPG
jgi:uncharacterized protein YbcV (DUF1398 family)